MKPVDYAIMVDDKSCVHLIETYNNRYRCHLDYQPDQSFDDPCEVNDPLICPYLKNIPMDKRFLERKEL